MKEKVITRLPPSPTGNLHIGTARTALFNFLYARQCGGEYLLRIEDTDKERSKPEYEEDILNGLAWLGIEHDALTRQTDNAERHKEIIHKLIDSGKAFLSKETSKQNPEETVEVVRLKNPNKDITFTDLVRGDITFNTEELGDFVLARRIDEPLYHLGVVVDDHDAGVTHVIRGEDHISNTPRQILIQEALGYERPLYAHIPLILAPDRSKLSKRRGATAISEYRTMGYLPEAMINYLALLGWNPGTEQELFTIDELIKSFSIENIQKGGAVFDITKLNWFNREYLKKQPPEEIERMVDYALKEADFDTEAGDTDMHKRLAEYILNFGDPHTQNEIQKLAQEGEYAFFFSQPSYGEVSLLPLKDTPPIPIVEGHLTRLYDLIDSVPEYTPVAIKEAVWEYATKEGRGQVLWPLRVALSGREKSPDPFTIAYILGKEETLQRIQNAIAYLRN